MDAIDARTDSLKPQEQLSASNSFVGLVNTVSMAVIGIVLATVLGT